MLDAAGCCLVVGHTQQIDVVRLVSRTGSNLVSCHNHHHCHQQQQQWWWGCFATDSYCQLLFLHKEPGRFWKGRQWSGEWAWADRQDASWEKYDSYYQQFLFEEHLLQNSHQMLNCLCLCDNNIMR